MKSNRRRQLWLKLIVLDGVYRTTEGVPEFHAVRASTSVQLQALLGRIIKRLLRFLTRKGYLIEEQGMTTLADTDPDLALGSLQAAACTYRIALGPRAGARPGAVRAPLGDMSGTGIRLDCRFNTGEPALANLSAIIRWLKETGYRFLTLRELASQTTRGGSEG